MIFSCESKKFNIDELERAVILVSNTVRKRHQNINIVALVVFFFLCKGKYYIVRSYNANFTHKFISFPDSYAYKIEISFPIKIFLKQAIKNLENKSQKHCFEDRFTDEREKKELNVS